MSTSSSDPAPASTSAIDGNESGSFPPVTFTTGTPLWKKACADLAWIFRRQFGHELPGFLFGRFTNFSHFHDYVTGPADRDYFPGGFSAWFCERLDWLLLRFVTFSGETSERSTRQQVLLSVLLFPDEIATCYENHEEELFYLGVIDGKFTEASAQFEERLADLTTSCTSRKKRRVASDDDDWIGDHISKPFRLSTKRRMIGDLSKLFPAFCEPTSCIDFKMFEHRLNNDKICGKIAIK